MRTGCTAMVQCILQGKFKQKISIINLLSISSFLGNLVVGKLCKEGKVKLKHDLKDKQSMICGTCDSERKFGQWQASSTWKRNFFFLRQRLAIWSKLALNTGFCCLSLPSPGVTGFYDQANDFINDTDKQYLPSFWENLLTEQFFIEMLFLFLFSKSVII